MLFVPWARACVSVKFQEASVTDCALCDAHLFPIISLSRDMTLLVCTQAAMPLDIGNLYP